MIRGSSLREFAKNSRVFAAFAPAEIGLSSFSSLVEPLLTTPLAFDLLIPSQRKATPSYETDTWNIAGGRSGVSINTLDSGFERPAV
jgi:hypothetical protein